MKWRVGLETLALDLKYATRALANNRGFTIAACLSLAIGIGANTAAFSVWDAVSLRSLPVRDPRALVLVTTRNAGSLRGMSHPSFTYLRDHSSSLEGLAAFRATSVNIRAGARTERVTGMLVSGNYFDLLGVPMALGSPILTDDDRTPRSGGRRGIVAVLSHHFWRQHMNADRGVIGQIVRVNGQPATVIGVAPSGFHGTTTGSMPSVYVPMMFAPHIFDGPWLENPRNLWLRMIGRLKPGTTYEQAQAEMTVTFRQFHHEFVVSVANTEPARRRAREAMIVLQPGHAGLMELGDTVRPTIFALVGLVVLVLLTACVNVAGLMVARSERLQKETAICIALGATRARVWSRTVIEGLVVGATSVVLGLMLAVWMRDVLARLVSVNSDLDVRLDWRVLGVAVMLGIAATLVISSVTAWSRARLGITRALKGEDISARLWLRKGLIVGQLAMSVVVLVMAALFAQTLNTLRLVDPGFEQQRVLIASISAAGYSAQRRNALSERLLEEVSALPGVIAAALAGNEPLQVNTGWSIMVRRRPGAEFEQAGASVMWISPNYFNTMGIPLLRGRDFEPRDRIGGAANPVIVNENFVRAYLGGADPIGANVLGNGNMTFEIIGVVKNSAAFSLRDLDQHMMYVPGGGDVLQVRSTIAPARLQASIEEAVHRLDPDVPVFNVRTIEQQLDRLLIRERSLAFLSTTFGMLALGLAAVGVYGVVSNAVSRRTKELGIRLALGAAPGRIVSLVLREASLLVALGALASIPCAFAVGRFIQGLLFGVAPSDAVSIAAAIAVLIAVATVAAWIPARRAARVDPLIALKAE